MELSDVRFDGRKLKAIRQGRGISVDVLMKRLSMPNHDYTYDLSRMTVENDERLRGTKINENRLRAYCRYFVLPPSAFAWTAEDDEAAEAEKEAAMKQ